MGNSFVALGIASSPSRQYDDLPKMRQSVDAENSQSWDKRWDKVSRLQRVAEVSRHRNMDRRCLDWVIGWKVCP